MNLPLTGWYKARDPLPSVLDGLRSVAMNFHIAVRRNVCSTIPQALSVMGEAMVRSGGMSIGTNHGLYHHSELVRKFIPIASARGADRFYTEIFSVRNQTEVDEWQDGGNLDALVWLLNRTRAHSERMRHFFFDMLLETHQHGLRVVTIDPANKPAYARGTNIFMRNFAWQDKIEEDQAGKDEKRPFVLLCGDYHMDPYRCGHTSPIHALLGIAGVRLGTGRPCLVPPLPVRKNAPAFMSVPRHSEQTPLIYDPSVQAGARIQLAA